MSQRRSRGQMSQPQSQSQGRGRGKRSSASAPDTSVGEGEDNDMTYTQPSTSQVQRGLEKLSQTQVDQKTAEVVQYFMVKDQKKLPIRRADLVKHVVKEYRNVYPEILKRASHVFEQVFGLKLVEIDTKNHIYILINKLEAADGPSLDTPTSPKMGLLFVILSIIFMKGGAVKESLIWNTLKKLRVDQGEKHEDFGDVKKLVTDEFVRQRYLEYAKVPHTEPIEHEFHWGQRADLEVSKIKILEFMGQIHEQDPKNWSQPYREATNTQASTSQR